MTPALHVQYAGNPEGPTLLLLHGGGVAGWMWRGQLDAFSGYRLVIPDLPGHGGSLGTPFTTIEDAAKRVCQLLDGAHDTTLVGFSLGAQIAVQILAQEPGLVSRAMVVSASTEPVAYFPLLAPVLRASVPLTRLRSFARAQARASFIPDDLFEEYFETSRSLDAGSFMAMMRANQTFRIPDGWSENRVPTLVVAGEKELPSMRRSAAALAQAAPGAKLQILPGIGHGLPLQDPGLFNELLAEWLGTQKSQADAR